MITWSINDKTDGCVLSNNNLTVDCSNGTEYYPAVRCTTPKVIGKWYFELTYEQVYNNGFGVCTKDFSFNTWLGGNSNSYVYFGHKGEWWSNGSSKSSTKSIVKIGDVIGVLLDCDNKTLQSVINGTLQNDKINYNLEGEIYVTFGKVNSSNGNVKGTVNFGNTKFDLFLKNNKLWKDLVLQGYKPYDYNYSSWFNRKFLISKDSQHYTIKGNELLLLENQILDRDNFTTNGFNSLDSLTQENTFYEETKQNESNVFEYDLNSDIKKIEMI